MQSRRRKPSISTTKQQAAKVAIDRHGRPAPAISQTAFQRDPSAVLRRASQRGAIEITRRGRPLAIAVSIDEFVALCVGYTMRSLALQDLVRPTL